MGELYSQIDPLRVADTYRSMQVAGKYGNRLAARAAGNAKHGTVDQLVTQYPSHDYVINRKEAAELFRRVRVPTTAEQTMAGLLSLVSDDFFHRSAAHGDAPALLNLSKWAASSPPQSTKPNNKAKT